MDQSRIRRILALALPIIGGMMSQNILNLVDTAMVGHLGDASIVAVGVGSIMNFVAIAFITGLSAGVQAVASRRLGQGRTEELADPLNGALLLAVGFGIPLSALLFLFAPQLFYLVNQDPEVLVLGIPYFQARLVAMVAVGINFSFRGFWNGIHLPKLCMRTLVVMHSCNLILNFLLIFGHMGFPELGALGAGIGTTISTFIGTAYYFYLGFKHARGNGFLHGLPGREGFRTMIRLTVPNGLQQVFFAAGLTTLFWILGQVGQRETAAANVLLNLMLVAILPALGLGMAAASMVGKALGREQPAEAKQWGWDVSKVAVVLLLLIGLPMVLFPDLILKLFFSKPEQAATLAMARVPLILVGATMFFDGVGIVLQNALIGAGASSRAMYVSTALQWGYFLPLAYLVGPIFGLGLLGIWVSQCSYKLLHAVIFAWQWKLGHWSKIRV